MSELTREQYAYAVNSLSNRNYEGLDEQLKLCADVFSHDAALRQQLAASAARVAKLEEQVMRFATYIKEGIDECWAGANPDATEQAAAALSQDGVGKE